MAWTPLTFAFGSLLTSTKMTQLQENFNAMSIADAGAPKISFAALSGSRGGGQLLTVAVPNGTSIIGGVGLFIILGLPADVVVQGSNDGVVWTALIGAPSPQYLVGVRLQTSFPADDPPTQSMQYRFINTAAATTVEMWLL